MENIFADSTIVSITVAKIDNKKLNTTIFSPPLARASRSCPQLDCTQKFKQN